VFNDRVLGRGQVTPEKGVSRPLKDFFYSLVRPHHYPSLMPQIGTVESYETPLGFHRFSCDFGEWAERAHNEPSDHYSPVPYYLYCRSIELALKAFLLARGLSKQDIASSRLGHSLMSLLTKAREHGLDSLVSVKPTWEQELARADDQYTKKDFEYFTVRFHLTHKPSPDILRELSRELRVSIRQACLDAADGPPPPHVATANAAFEAKRRRRKSAA